MRKVKLVRVYAVMLVTGKSIKELFRSTEKVLCKQYKKENRSKGKLGIIWIDNVYHSDLDEVISNQI